MSLEEYDLYSGEFISWSLRDETIKYCELDCKILYDILIKYNEFIFKYFNLNIGNTKVIYN